MIAAQRAKTLNQCGFRPLDTALLERNEAQHPGKGLEQLARTQQKLRVGRFSKAFVPRGEGFIDENAAIRERPGERRKQRPVQVVDHDYRREAPVRQGPGRPVLEVRNHRLNAGR